MLQGANLPDLYTTAQAAEELGLSHSHVRTLVRLEGIGQLLGPRVRVLTADDLKALKAAHKRRTDAKREWARGLAARRHGKDQ